MAADGGVSASQVAWFPAEVALAEGDFDLVIECVLGADVGALLVRVGTDFSQALESVAEAFWRCQDGDLVRLETGTWSVAGFELALKSD